MGYYFREPSSIERHRIEHAGPEPVPLKAITGNKPNVSRVAALRRLQLPKVYRTYHAAIHVVASGHSHQMISWILECGTKTQTSRIVIPGFRSQHRKSPGLVALAITFILYGVIADAQLPPGKIPRIGYLDSGSAADRETAAYRRRLSPRAARSWLRRGKEYPYRAFRYDRRKI